MKRFEFRLARVLKLRKQQQWQAELRQQQARALLDAAQLEVMTLEYQLAQYTATLAAQLGQAVDLGSWIVCYEQSGQIGRALDRAEEKVKEAERKLQEADAFRVQKATEVEALKFLRSQEWQAYHHDMERDRQEQLDELSLHRWMNGHSE